MRNRINYLLSACFVSLLASAAWTAEPADDLRIYQTPDDRQQARSMLVNYFQEKTQVLWDKRDKELAAIDSPEAWRARQQRTRNLLPEILGDFGEKCPLDARIVGTLDHPDYVIEKLIFQSQPNYYCTANVYVPKDRLFPQPGVLFTCGHAADGKAAVLYHEACLGLVLKGYVVLALDPMGQGERSEYFEPETGKPLVPLCVSQHHYLARPSWLVGRTLAGYRTWDTTRAVDYLRGRSGTDRRCGQLGGRNHGPAGHRRRLPDQGLCGRPSGREHGGDLPHRPGFAQGRPARPDRASPLPVHRGTRVGRRIGPPPQNGLDATLLPGTRRRRRPPADGARRRRA